MRQEVPYIEVELTLVPSTAGARSQRIPPAGYRPHFRVGGGEYLGIEIVDAHEFQGGDIRSVAKVRLLYWPEVNYEELSIGTTFEVLEGPTVVGHGRVVTGSHAI